MSTTFNHARRILLADDFVPFRRNLAEALSGKGGVEVVGEASNGSEAVELARSLRPAVIFMDYRMPEMNGVAAITRILEENPKTEIVVTSLSFERQYVLRALAAGARGYLAKEDALGSLDEGMQATVTGRSYLSPSVEALIHRTAPPNPLSITQLVLWTFDSEAPALLNCARSVADYPSADAAVDAAFLAYWMALREGHSIADPQTWLLLSIAASLFPAHAVAPKPWSFTRAHPQDRDFQDCDFQDRDLKNPASDNPRLREHVAACRPCHLAWTLAAHDPRATVDCEELRNALIHELEVPDEPQLFLTFAERQAGVMRLAASELNVLLGSEAGRGWMRREASAGSWLGAFLGGKAGVRGAVNG